MPTETQEEKDKREEEDKRIYFRDELRAARYIALKDSEAFEPIIQVFERWGYLIGVKRCGLQYKQNGLAQALGEIKHEVTCSPLCQTIPSGWPGLHLSFEELQASIPLARNDAVHQGATARHLTRHAIELAVIVEDALTMNLSSRTELD